MKSKLLACLLFSVVFVGTISAQTIQNEQKLKNFWGTAYYTKLLQSSPHVVEAMDYRISNGYVLHDSVQKKFQSLPVQTTFLKRISKTETATVSAQQIINEIHDGTFNILQYDFPQKKNTDVVIRIGATHTLTIRSVTSLLYLKNH